MLASCILALALPAEPADGPSQAGAILAAPLGAQHAKHRGEPESGDSNGTVWSDVLPYSGQVDKPRSHHEASSESDDNSSTVWSAVLPFSGQTVDEPSLPDGGGGGHPTDQVRGLDFQDEADAQRRACSGGLCWPTLFLLGVQKAATTSLYNTLMTHRKVCGADASQSLEMQECSACSAKETHFFCAQRTAGGIELNMSVHAYHKLFQERKLAGCSRFMEATPSLQQPKIGRKIASTLPLTVHPLVRMLLVLREPISRDLSWYNHQLDNYHRRGGHFDDVNAKAPSYTAYTQHNLRLARQCAAKHSEISCSHHVGHTLAWGMYYPQLKDLLMTWPRKHVFIMQMDRLVDHTHSTLTAVYKFAGFSGSPSHTLPKDNAHDGPWKVDSVECDVLRELRAFYAPYNQQLYALFEEGGGPHAEPEFGGFKFDIKCHE